MKTMRVYPLNNLSPTLFLRLKQAQMEAARVWNLCVQAHKAARMAHAPWPERNELQQVTKGRFALHSQSVQRVVHAFLANIEATRTLRKEYPEMRMKYPWRTKQFYPVHWPAQAVSRQMRRVVLPMGRGRPSLVLPVQLPENAGACTLVWNRGFELHVCVEAPQAQASPGAVRATVDLGEIHLAAVTTTTGKALIVTGRGIRSLKRQRAKQTGHITRKQSRCQKHSRRWRKLQRVKNTICRRSERCVRDLRHKATRQVIDFCTKHEVGTLFIGNPHGVRTRDSGRRHNGRMAQWEYGRDIDYLAHKSIQARILSFTGSERGTSSRCPRCKHRQKPRGRNWVCRACGFRGHRDLVGSVNMHLDAYGIHLKFPRSFTYLHPGPLRTGARSSRAGTPLVGHSTCCLDQLPAQPSQDLAGLLGDRPPR
ncbi:MAG TPA: transposase [Ktedonobacteraceae bacterium]|nr:transposase [Ktedonobacteraceae bacterium]